MTEIRLRELVLTNFKGIRDLVITFGKETSISGDNGTGKTTIADAYFWLLFDKDSTDRKDFNIKTLDSNNNPLPGLNHSVEGKFSINGKVKTFKKTYREKWTKQRGEAEKVFTGHETIYEINGVPVRQTDYNEAIREIAEKEQIFKMLSNVLYFNTGLKWQDRRAILMQMNGTITPETVINYEPSLYPLRELLQDTTIEKLKAKIAASIKKLNTEIASIPFRIDECNKAIVKDVDFLVKRNELTEKKKQLSKIDSQLQLVNVVDPTKQSKLVEINKLRGEIALLEIKASNELNKRKQELNNRIKDAVSKIKNLESQINSNENQLNRYKDSKEKTEKLLAKYRDDFKKEQAKEFVLTDDFVCPTCKRALDQNVIEAKKQEMEESFNNTKAETLKSINENGKRAKEQVKEYDRIIQELEESISNANEEIQKHQIVNQQYREELKKVLNENLYENEQKELLNKIAELEAGIEEPTDSQTEIEKLKTQKSTLQTEIENLNKELAKEDNNKIMGKRILELSNLERQLSEQIAELQKQQYLCEEHTKKEVELVEGEINSRFNIVKWKLFKTQINGGVEECCEALIDGVPFADANTASKINAGLDIINCLSNIYQISVPVWIDNKESVISLIDTPSQVITLKVVEDQPLSISNN